MSEHQWIRTIPTDGRWCEACGMSASHWAGEVCSGKGAARVVERRMAERLESVRAELDNARRVASMYQREIKAAQRRDERPYLCPGDNQAEGWHLRVDLFGDKTNGELIGCPFGSGESAWPEPLMTLDELRGAIESKKALRPVSDRCHECGDSIYICRHLDEGDNR